MATPKRASKDAGTTSAAARRAAQPTPASKTPTPTTTSAAKKSAAKKSAAKKSAAKKSAAKKSAARSGSKKVKGTILFFDPATGRGAIEAVEVENNISLDVANTKILNKGYVRLDAGRDVTVSVKDDAATDLMAE